MSAQETTEKTTTPRKRAGTREKAAEQAEQIKAGQSDDAFKDPPLEEQIETLVPHTGSKLWMIGKPPEHGGEEGEWETYTQSKLGFIEMQMFFAICSRALLKAIKEGGEGALSELTGMMGGGDIRAMSRQLQQQDFNEAANFMSMAFSLISYVPDFLSDCYILWLRVPEHQQYWFRREIKKPYNPDSDQYGLTRTDGREMIERFLDQNYEEIRDFFVSEIPNLAKRVRKLDEETKKKEVERESGSQRSKQSST